MERFMVTIPGEAWITDVASDLGLGGLAILSFTEALIQPIPPDPLYLVMLFANLGDQGQLLALFLTITLSSVAGALAGYWLGAIAGRPLLDRFAKERSIASLERLIERHGQLGIFIAACSPIPYKVLAWVAGMGRMEIRPFLLAGLVGRGLRFGLEAVLVIAYGEQALEVIRWMLDQEMVLLGLIVLGILVAWALHQRSRVRRRDLGAT